MQKWMEYGKEAVQYATPYVKKAGAYACDFAEQVGKSYHKGRRMIERDRRLKRMHQTLGIIKNIVVILGSVAALIALLKNIED